MQQSGRSELRETYRALLARGLEPGEAANLTAFLHGLPIDRVRWSVREVEALVAQRRGRTGRPSPDDISDGGLQAPPAPTT